ncbi:helix-turn-helix domain-containing protein [Larkinella rosea]|uniref:AraC family transcriptional regulator n=1 Tax=Larkinella rosea TaxID=2025312 RepID=A0A3P1BVB0_9BACT|nr:AraC family transcriptional regulator [Larkinella rosea]RRB04932.1 AraC family transcriptional regulator [Larkinella rosea]
MSIVLEQLSLIVIYAGIVQGVFVTLLLNNRSVRKSRANWFLSVLLLAMSFSIFHSTFMARLVHHFSIPSYTLGDPVFLLIAPLLWFYFREVMGQPVRFSFFVLLHFVPFLFAIFFSLLLKSFPAESPLIQYLAAHRGWKSIPFWVVVVLQSTGYLVFIQKKWLTYQKFIEQEVSNTENINLSWVRFFLGVFLGIMLFFLLLLLNVIHHGDMSWSARAIAVIFSLSIFALGYKGILQKQIFQIRIIQPPAEPATAVPETENREADPQVIDRLLRYMEEEKPYLDPELTLSSLAKQLQLSRSFLSQLINEGVGDNFYNFVNRYRVEQVKRFMNDPSMRHFNLLGLALEAGFKSKSTFNLIFKRFTGLTPSEYLQTVSK